MFSLELHLCVVHKFIHLCQHKGVFCVDDVHFSNYSRKSSFTPALKMTDRGSRVVVSTIIDEKALKLKLHSSLAHITYKLDALAIKSWFYFISAAFPHIQKEAAVYKVDIGGYTKYLNTRNTDHLKKVFNKLKSTEVRLNIFDKDTGADVPYDTMLLAGSGHKDNSIYFEIPVSLRDVILRYEEMFVLLNLALIKDFSSKYTLALYVSLRDYAIESRVTSKILTIDDIRLLFGLEGTKFEEYKALHRNVIKVAVNEINEKGDMKVSYEQLRVNRKVEKIKFTFEVNEDAKRLNKQGAKISAAHYDVRNLIHKDIIGKLNDIVFVFHKKNIDALDKLMAAPYSLTAKELDEYLLFLLEEVEKQESKNKLEGVTGSPGGLLSKMIISNSRLEAFEKRLEARRKEEKRRQEQQQKEIVAKLEDIEKQIREIHAVEVSKEFRKYLLEKYDELSSKLSTIAQQDVTIKMVEQRDNTTIGAMVLNSNWKASFRASMMKYYDDLDFTPKPFQLEHYLEDPAHAELKREYRTLQQLLI